MNALFLGGTKIKTFDEKNVSFFSDGKFHVVPSGDLHILRADLPSDGAVDYTCKVRNKLTSTEHSSPAFSLIIDGSAHDSYVVL